MENIRQSHEINASDSQLDFIDLFAQFPIAIAIISRENLTFRIVNSFYAELVGRKPKDLVEKPLLEALPELKGQGFDKLIINVLETGVAFRAKEVPVELIRSNGLETIYVNLNYEPRRERGSQKIIGVFVVATDVTEQVRSRQTIEESENKLRIIMNNAPLAIGLYVGKDMVIENPNQTFIEILGKGPNIEGLPLREALPELITEGQPFLDILDNVYTTGIPFATDGTLIKIIRNGEMTNNFYNFSYTPVFDADGKTFCIVVIAKDVTEEIISRQQLEESERRLEQKNKELLLINKDLDNFVYTASHDLTAPMSNIEGLLIALRDSLTSRNIIDEDSEAILSLMDESVERFKNTIHDLTDVARLNKEAEGGLEEVNLLDCLNDVIFSLRDQISLSNAEITIHLKNKILAYSKKNLHSILLNLVSNSIKYRHPHRIPVINISSETYGNYVLLKVQDNGMGVKSKNIPEMFGMFKRLHNHVEGTGIGLYIVKRIVENAGGRIEVESEVNKGTIFKVFLNSIKT